MRVLSILGLLAVSTISGCRSQPVAQVDFYKYREDVPAAQAAVQKNKDDVAAHYTLSKHYEMQKDIPNAIKHQQEVVRLAPNYPNNELHLARQLEKAGRKDEALKIYQKYASHPEYGTRVQQSLKRLQQTPPQ